MPKCPKCNHDAVERHPIHAPSKKKLRCARCGAEVEPCADCGGSGCGDYPFPCGSCRGEGIKT